MSIPCTVRTTAPMSPNLPPAFMRMPPPIVPGMPARFSMPARPPRTVRTRSFCMSPPAPARAGVAAPGRAGGAGEVLGAGQALAHGPRDELLRGDPGADVDEVALVLHGAPV